MKRDQLDIGIDIEDYVMASQRQVGGDHYKNMGVEPWDVVDTWPVEQQIGYYRGGALKYIMRMGSKDERVQEAKKGLHYMEKLIETLEYAEYVDEDEPGVVNLSGVAYPTEFMKMGGTD